MDLEALEPDEIDVLLADMIRAMSQTKGSKVYPLLQKVRLSELVHTSCRKSYLPCIVVLGQKTHFS